VHSARLERLGEGLAGCSGGTIDAHLGVVLAVEASAIGNLDVVPRNSVATSGMEGVVHASASEPYLGF
jgi:hypothetical protein